MYILFLLFVPVLCRVPIWSSLFELFEPITDRTHWQLKNNVSYVARVPNDDTLNLLNIILLVMILWFIVTVFSKDKKN
jgi:hypothetical protein